MANELIEFRIEDKQLGFRSSGLATNANYHVKRTVILLFINHRSVESTNIKRAIEQTYSAFLPKGGHPFVYIDLEIEPQRVDVNVHPTKREVHFLNEDEIVESICNVIRSKLAQVDSSRTFMTQSLLPGAISMQSLTHGTDNDVGASHPKPSTAAASTTRKPYEHNLVRTDSRVRKITSMLSPAIPQTETDSSTLPALNDGLQYETTDREPIRIALTSVKNLRAAVRAEMHDNLTETFASHTYVGLVDERRRIAAIQSGVKLYLIDYGMVCNELFYQIGLTDFGNFGVIKLDPPPRLVDLLKIAADTEYQKKREIRKQRQSLSRRPSTNEEQENEVESEETEEIFTTAPEVITRTLTDRREMLNEYFSLEISADGTLLTIPLLLKGYIPSLAKLPRFLLRLGPYVNWNSEEDCFRSFLRELAAYYTPEQLPAVSSPAHSNGIANVADERDKEEEASKGEDEFISCRRAQMIHMLEHSISPALRARLVATTGLLRGVVEVADLKGLYRVFERC